MWYAAPLRVNGGISQGPSVAASAGVSASPAGEAGFFLSSHELEHRSERDRYIASSDQFQRAQRVASLIITLGIAGNDSDTQGIHLR